ncbi:hypothetical protein QTP70_027886 [Hemibagrus guttatus]|uniref:SGNH hydrolase-type esterase domain-containing protein n=1 Tax=Hemibagrus guttatus TaxID=175788 RepID=A0AAE0RGT7_9TELE|nr:hypothetical protein QTP70_027886 [Hemibagrus guttatus]
MGPRLTLTCPAQGHGPPRFLFTPAPGYHAAWMQQQRKTRAKPRAGDLSPPRRHPSSRSRPRTASLPFARGECDTVIIGDSIVRHVPATAAKGKVHTRCLPGARVLDVSAQVPAILKKNIGAVVLHAGTNDIGLRQTEILKKGTSGAWWSWYAPHRPRRGSSCQGHFPRSSKESRGSVDYLLLMNGYSHGVKIRNYLLWITGIFSGSVLGSTFPDGLHPSRVGAAVLSDNISRTLRTI